MKELTPRQKEILESLANGNTMQETALKLDISYSVVKDHCSNAYERLGLTRPRAVTAIIKAWQTGQITLG
jgi:DNA-binding CsgD family transcriptional regulator